MEADGLYLACGRRETHEIAVGGNFGVGRLLLGIESVKGLFLASDEHFLCACHNEVAALVLDALAGFGKECGRLAVENAVAGVEHDRDLEERDAGEDTDLGRGRRGSNRMSVREDCDLYMNIGHDGGRIAESTEAGFVREKQTGLFRELECGRADFNLG